MKEIGITLNVGRNRKITFLTSASVSDNKFNHVIYFPKFLFIYEEVNRRIHCIQRMTRWMQLIWILTYS